MNKVLSFTRGTHAFHQAQPLICSKDLQRIVKTHRSPSYQSEMPAVLIHPTSRSMLLLEMGFNFGAINWSSNRFQVFYFIEQLTKCLKSILILDVLFTQLNVDDKSFKGKSVLDMYTDILEGENKDIIQQITFQFVNALKWYMSLGVVPVMTTNNNVNNKLPAWNTKTYLTTLKNYQACEILELKKFDDLIISIQDRETFVCTDYSNHPISLISFEKICLDSIFGFTSFMGRMLEIELEYIYGQKVKTEYALINQSRTVLVVASQHNSAENEGEKKSVVNSSVSGEHQVKKNSDVLRLLNQNEVNDDDDDDNDDGSSLIKEDYKQIMNEISILQKNIQNQKNGVKILGNPEPISSASQYISPIHRYGSLSDSIKEQSDISARIFEHEQLKDRAKKAEIESILYKKKVSFLERDLHNILRRYNDLMNLYNVNEVTIRAMKEKTKYNKKKVEKIEQQNERLQKQLEKSNSVIQQLLNQSQMAEEEKRKYVHLFLNTPFNVKELIQNTTREELINTFIGTLNVSNIDTATEKDITIDQLLLQNKIFPQPIFLHVKSQHNLMMRNSWLPADWMEDKPINICQNGREDNMIESNKNIIQSSTVFQIIDANPIDSSQTSSSASSSSSSSINKRFMAIQHPQAINLKEMYDVLKQKWSENIKILFALKDDLYTVHGQKVPAVITETSIYYFIVSFLNELFSPCFMFQYLDPSISLILSYYLEQYNIPSVYETIILFYSKYIEKKE